MATLCIIVIVLTGEFESPYTSSSEKFIHHYDTLARLRRNLHCLLQTVLLADIGRVSDGRGDVESLCAFRKI